MNEAMKQAWLEISQMLGEPTREELDVFLRTWQRASQATREALAEQPAQQEPVAWMHTKIDDLFITHRPADIRRHPDRWMALYKDPTPCPTCEALARTVMLDQTYHENISPQRTWVGLTDEERNQVAWSCGAMSADWLEFADAIEAKLREKNA